MAQKKPADQTYAKGWLQTDAWARANGMSDKAISAVFAMDYSNFSTSGSPMSTVQRAVAISAANDPNNVYTSPTQNPSVASVLGNVRHDLGSITTGFMPQNFIKGSWHMLANSFDDIIHPSRLFSRQGIAMAFQNTLLSLIPGAADFGEVLGSSSVGKGFEYLLQHPLISAVDLLPVGFSKVGTKAAMESESVAKLAAKAGFTRDLARETSLGKFVIKTALGQVTKDSPIGIVTTPLGREINKLSPLGQLHNFMNNTMVAPIVKDMVSSWMKAGRLGRSTDDALYGDVFRQLASLPDSVKEEVNAIYTRHETTGEDLPSMLDPKNPMFSDAAKNTVTFLYKDFIPHQFEQMLFRGDVVEMRLPSGRTAVYAKASTNNNIFKAQAAVRLSMKSLIEVGHKFRDHASTLELSNLLLKDQLAPDLEKQIGIVRELVDTHDPELSKNVVRSDANNKVRGYRVFGVKRDIIKKFVGVNGNLERLVDHVKAAEYHEAVVYSKALLGRMDKWGAESFDSKDFDELTQLRRTVLAIHDWADNAERSQEDMIAMAGFKEGQITAVEMQEREQHKRELLDDLRVQHDNSIADLKLSHNMHLNELPAEANAHISNLQADIPKAARLGDAGLQREIANTKEKLRIAKAELKGKQTAEMKALKKENASEYKIKDAEMSKENAERPGEYRQALAQYQKAVDKSNKEVWKNPEDSTRNLRYELTKKYMFETLVNKTDLDGATTIAAHAKIVQAMIKARAEKLGYKDNEIAQVLTDPGLMTSAAIETLEEIRTNPDNIWDPNIQEVAAKIFAKSERAAIDHINIMYARGAKFFWAPAIGATERVSDDLRPLIGKGEPHVDAAMKRSNRFQNHRYDIIAALDKTAHQMTLRDITAHFTTEFLQPHVLTYTELKTILEEYTAKNPEEAGRRGLKGSLLSAREDLQAQHGDADEMARAFGFVPFDAQRMLGFVPENWKKQKVYIQQTLLKGMDAINAEQKKGYGGVWDKITGTYKMSVTGLSPRYTMHITFGQMMMLAADSSWRAFTPKLVSQAYRALKEGTNPEEIYRHTNLGPGKLDQAFGAFNYHAGNKMGELIAQENYDELMDQMGGEKLNWADRTIKEKINPTLYLKAVARANYKLTSMVTDMYTSIAYLDHASKAEDTGFYVDEVTGKKMAMTRERAMHEGIQHVAAVFGDLDRMSPIERTILRKVFPFYGWQSHILKYILHMGMDNPQRSMVLSLMAYDASENVPPGLPQRIQFLFFLGKPGQYGLQPTVDLRFMDPFRDVSNFTTLAGFFQSLNPIIGAAGSMLNPQQTYGTNTLYPTLSYSDLYGTKVAGSQGNLITAAEQFVPQVGALQQAMSLAHTTRQLTRRPNAFYKTIFESLGVPFLQLQDVSKQQIQASVGVARYEVAKQAAATAFQTGQFGTLQGYTYVPNPLNAAIPITPQQLEAIYNEALRAYPGQAPINTLTPPPTPPGL